MLSIGSTHVRNVIQWHKNSCFFQKITKNRPTAGGFAPRPQSLRPLGAPPPHFPSVICLSYTGFLKTSPKLRICTFQLYWFKPSPFAKSWLSANKQIFDDVIACDLWFKPPQSKVLATPINWRLPEKLLWRPFFWRTLVAVSLVLGLGLEHSCSWPREGLSSERLSLALASFFFCVLGLEPCVLDSTSGVIIHHSTYFR